MQQSIGESIRQLRRQHSLTQTELGDERFSKSYVSAVEREKIVPSHDALRFFAEQLGQPGDFFEKLLQEFEQVPVLAGPRVYNPDAQNVQDKVQTFLDIMMEGTESYNRFLLHELPVLTPESLVGLPLHKQAHYSFLMGLLAQEKGDFSTALHAFERALPFAPANLQPAILDALGLNSYHMHAYQTAVNYHMRALYLLQEGVASNATSELLLNVELNCGNAYRVLGAHRQARDHFERARRLLRSTHDIKTAAQIHLGLGYSTYAHAYQNTTFVGSNGTTQREIEHELERAISFLIQSRTLYQVSDDRMGESRARLSQVRVLLDLCTLRRQVAQEKARTTGTLPPINCATFLDEAEEQCRQVLMTWQDVSTDADAPTAELEMILSGALAFFIRVYVQRATLARLGGYADTAVRERSIATHLCQQVLNTLSQPAFPWALIRETVTLRIRDVEYRSQALPCLPDLSTQPGAVLRSAMSQAEIYFAAGEIAEELGLSATTLDYSVDCYTCADQCLRTALSMMRSAVVIPSKEYDPTYLVRYFQRCVNILEERILASPEVAEETTHTLLGIFKDGLYLLHDPILTMVAEQPVTV